MVIGDKRRFKKGDLLLHKQCGDVVTYVGPPNGPWADFEGWGIVRFSKPMPVLPKNHEFNVDLYDYERVDMIDAIGRLDHESD